MRQGSVKGTGSLEASLEGEIGTLSSFSFSLFHGCSASSAYSAYDFVAGPMAMELIGMV